MHAANGSVKSKTNILDREMGNLLSKITEFNSEVNVLTNATESLKILTTKDISNTKIDMNSKFDDVRDTLKSIQDFQNKMNSQISANKKELNRQDISIEKALHMCMKNDNVLTKECLKQVEFIKTVDNFEARLKYVQHSAEDIDRKLMSTDNYIEKYLPLKIHKFIISSLWNVFDSKKDIKKLKDYEFKRDWLLNETIKNDDGIPGDFKKKVPEDTNYKMERPRSHKKSKRTKEKQDSRAEDSPSSIANSSFISPRKKYKGKKSKVEDDNKSLNSKRGSAKSSKRSPSKIFKNVNDSISYQNSVHEEDRLNKILKTPTRDMPTIEVRKPDQQTDLAGDVRDSQKIQKMQTQTHSSKHDRLLQNEQTIDLDMNAEDMIQDGDRLGDVTPEIAFKDSEEQMDYPEINSSSNVLNDTNNNIDDRSIDPEKNQLDINSQNNPASDSSDTE